MILINLCKTKYRFNNETLEYEQIEIKWKKLLKHFIYSVLAVGVLTYIFIQIFISSIETPKEILLAKQNEILKNKYFEMHSKLDSFSMRLSLLNRADDSVYRAVFGERPISKPIRLAGIGGNKTIYSDSADYNQLVKNTNQKLQQLSNQFKISEKSYAELLEKAKKEKKRLKHIPAIMPVHNKNLERTGSGFGKRFHPILGIWRMHEGLDFNAPEGTRIFATGDGNVKKTYRSKTFGNCVIIDHGYGYETFYAHLQKFNVKQGAQVKRGDVIGFMGTTGLSSGVHLHYEVHLNGKEVDPVNYFYNDLSPEQYQHIIELASGFKNSMD